jgi:hypothetical protein
MGGSGVAPASHGHAQEEYVHQINDQGFRATSPAGRQLGYAEWIAVGAVIAGSVGALVGAAKCSRVDSRLRGLNVSEYPDPSTLTPPHGDKLPSAVV